MSQIIAAIQRLEAGDGPDVVVLDVELDEVGEYSDYADEYAYWDSIEAF